MSLWRVSPQIPSPSERIWERKAANSGPEAAALIQRAKKREKRAKERAEARENLIKEGNDFCRDGYFSGAVEKFEQAIQLGGRKRPFLLSNLADAYLKIGLYEQAEEVATEALIYDPTNAKARCRRGLARKGLGRAIGASIDFETVIQYGPEAAAEAAEELKIVKKIVEDGQNSPSDDEYNDEEYDWPPCIELEKKPQAASDSESSDCEHIGSHVPCRSYNRGGCNRGRQCEYSHAPDDESIRDDLGKNVCMLAMIGSCQDGEEKCSYSHNMTYLPLKGWWNNREVLGDMNGDISMARDAQRDRSYTFRILHGFLYDCGYGPPRGLEAILYRGTLGHSLEAEAAAPSAPIVTAPNRRFILIIALEQDDMFQSVHTGLLDALNAKVETRLVSTADVALDLLSSPYLAGILIADAGFVEHKYTKLATKVAEYTKNGGLVVHGGLFSSFVKLLAVPSYFQRVWGLQWKSGSYTSNELGKNTHNGTVKLNPSLPASCYIKALYLMNVARNDAMYTVTEGYCPPSEAAIVHVKHGKGHLGYVGDVSGDDCSTTSILAMFGLLDHAYQLSPNTLGKQSDSSTKVPAKPTPTFSNHFVMLLSLQNADWFHEMYKDVFVALRKMVRVKQALTSKTALSLLASSDLAAVFITDFGIAEAEHTPLLRKVVEYAKAGGVVVAGGQFSSNLYGPVQDAAFFRAWGLPWKRGSYHRETFRKNMLNGLVQLNPSLPESYSMKALQLTGISQESAMYIESAVYTSTPKSESPIVYTRIGKGYFGYIGDVNEEEESTMILPAMLRLLDRKQVSTDNIKGSTSSSDVESKLPTSSAGKEGAAKRRAKKKKKKPTNAAVPPVAATSNSLVLVISFSDSEDSDLYRDERERLFKILEQHSLVVRASTAAVALQSLSSPDLTGVLVDEPSIANGSKYAAVLNKLIAYAKAGGLVVFGGSFSSLAGVRVLDEFWERKWGVQWTYGSYRHASPGVLRDHGLFKACPWLVNSYTMKAVHLRCLDRTAVYRDSERANEAAVLRAQVGEGFVGYTGDVFAEMETAEITLAMLGILQHPINNQ